MTGQTPDPTDGLPVSAADRLEAIRTRVAAAAERGGRTTSGITIVAVSKTFDDDAVRAARAAGQLDFGESRAKPLARRLDADPPLDARWHFVGRLQRNKVDLVCGNVTLIHSIDRMRLAVAVADRATELGIVQRGLLQVNVSEDPAKGGFAVDEAMGAIAAIRERPGVSIQGLMTIPALDADPAAAFTVLRDLRDDIRARFPEVLHLSMGMSADYEVAVEHGATLIRVGTAVFGPRDP